MSFPCPIHPNLDLINNAKSSPEFQQISDTLSMVIVRNKEVDGKSYWDCKPEAQYIQYYFALGGDIEFSFAHGNYKRSLRNDHSLLIYQPGKLMSFSIELSADASLCALFIHVKDLHNLFVHDLAALPFLDSGNERKSFYEERMISNQLGMVLGQVMHQAQIPSNTQLYYKAKALEILSFYFHRSEQDDATQCPFLLDEDKVNRLRRAKHILQDRILDPPTLKELAREIGLNEYQLKVGFKNIYGQTVFQYLSSYKMQLARKMLDQQNLLVNEVSDKVGYSNPSHFIVAFKKHFGVTPKKYLMSLR